METSRRVHVAALPARYRLAGRRDPGASARPPALVVPALPAIAPDDRRPDPSTAGASAAAIGMSPAADPPRAAGAAGPGFAARPPRVVAGAAGAGGACTLDAGDGLEVFASQSGRCRQTYGATPASKPTRTTMPRIFELFMPIPALGRPTSYPDADMTDPPDLDMWQTCPRPAQRETPRPFGFKRLRCEMNSTRVTPDGAPRVAWSPRPSPVPWASTTRGCPAAGPAAF